MLSPLSWNPDPDHQDEMIEDQHEKGKGSSTVMAARKHAMGENLFQSLERQARFARPSMTTINFNNINELKSIYFFKKYVKKLYLVSLI